MGIPLFRDDGLSMSLWGPNSPHGRALAYDPDGPDSTRPNPNPEVFTVREAIEVGKFVVCRVNYPDATTFEGDKIMVLRGTSNPGVVEAQRLDPHFSEDGMVVAKFRPDEEGWKLALAITAFMDGLEQV